MLTFGDATIDTITDLDPFALPIDLLFPGRTVADLREYETVLSPHHVDFGTARILLGVHSHLLRIGGRNILIDTCIGEHKPRPRRADDWHQRRGSGYLERLAAHGLRPDDIDMVLCTHLHADHVGWNTKLVDGRWLPTFPNARYLVGKQEFTHWQEAENKAPGQHNHGSFIDSVLPILEAGQLDLVDADAEIADGISLKPLPGHSPGQIGLCICHGTEKAVFCADAIHSVVQVYHPDWVSRFCSDPEMAIATRMELLKDSANNGTILIPAHLRHFSGMRIRRVGSGFVPEFVT
ncbi:MBL fold metallo-hydrolase [Agrobacterium rosae]|uniref:MBL fold metallo-hydrolase n=1 Tax=Agrobacterium rosae TaxID=1972867 RepID=UPI003A7F661F